MWLLSPDLDHPPGGPKSPKKPTFQWAGLFTGQDQAFGRLRQKGRTRPSADSDNSQRAPWFFALIPELPGGLLQSFDRFGPALFCQLGSINDQFLNFRVQFEIVRTEHKNIVLESISIDEKHAFLCFRGVPGGDSDFRTARRAHASATSVQLEGHCLKQVDELAAVISKHQSSSISL